MLFLDKSKRNGLVKYKYREAYILVIMEKEVSKEGLFELAINYHYQNLLSSLPHFKDGQIFDTHGLPLQEGIGENPYSHGFLMFFDGAKILEKAKTLALRKQTGIRETSEVKTESRLVDYLRSQRDTDSVYFLNTVNKEITKVKGELNNGGIEDLDDLLARSYPKNFLSSDESIPIYDAGNKTGIASIVTGQYTDVEAIMVKNAPYEFGVGKVIHVREGKLQEEFFFRHDPKSTGPFFNAEHSIVGVYRRYEPRDSVDENGEFIIAPHLVEEKILDPASLGLRSTNDYSAPVYTIQPPQPSTPKIAAVGNFSLAANDR